MDAAFDANGGTRDLLNMDEKNLLGMKKLMTTYGTCKEYLTEFAEQMDRIESKLDQLLQSKKVEA